MIPFATTDLAMMFDTDDFAETITVGGSSVPAIFDAAFSTANFANGAIEGTLPRATCKTADVSAAVHGTVVVVRSVSYYVVGIQADGSGLTVLALSENRE